MIRLAVRCRAELAELVLAELVELAPSGVEERRADGHVELAIYGAPGELPELGELEAVAGDALIEVSSSEVADDWPDRWREFHRPVAIGAGRIVVRPPWSEPGAAGEAGGVDVVIDPGGAFGTGAHVTTRLCLELLAELADTGAAAGPLADLGTGSGVLAIAAAKLGWGPVLAADSELAALDAARANAEANGVDLELRRVDLRREPPPYAPVVVANLTAPLLGEVAGRLEKPPQTLVCSGLLAAEAEGVGAAFGAAGLAPAEERIAGDWAALRLAALSDLRGD